MQKNSSQVLSADTEHHMEMLANSFFNKKLCLIGLIFGISDKLIKLTKIEMCQFVCNKCKYHRIR